MSEPADDETPAPSDWAFEIDGEGWAADSDAARRLALDTAGGSMNALRAQFAAVKALASHAEHCLRAAANAGVPPEQLASDLDLRLSSLQAVLEGRQPLVGDVW